MSAILALCIPALITVCLRERIFVIDASWKKRMLLYLKSILVLNWLMLMILFYGFQNSGNIFSKLNTHHMFACKYIALSVFMSIAELFAEKFIKKYFKCMVREKQYDGRDVIVKKNIHVSTLLLYGLFLTLMMVTIANKSNYHVDEMYSYGLANHQGSHVISFEDGTAYTPSLEPYLDYLTVNENHRFDYENVWKNQSNDVHPPLYYAILHTICSVFAGMFSKWYAGIINIVFALLTLFILRKLIRHLTMNDEPVCMLVSITFVLSSGILSSVSFFRMYILAMFLVTFLTYMLVKEVGRWKFDLKFFVSLFLIALLGALTHYYCIMYTVFICAVFCILLVIKRNWYSVIGFIVTGTLSGGTAYMIFPSMIKHMFFGYRGTEAIENLKQTPYEFWTRIKQFYNIVNKQIFGNCLGYIAVFIIFTLVFYCIVEGHKNFKNVTSRLLTALNADNTAARIIAIRYMLIFLPVFIYFLFVSKAAAYMADRYMMPIYGIAFVGLISLAIEVMKNVFKEKTVFLIVSAMLSIIVVNEWTNIGWNYLYRSSISLLEEAENYGDVDCLYIYDSKWKAQSSFMEIKNYASITFIKEKDINYIAALEIADKDQLIVMIINNKEETLTKIMDTYSQLNKYKKIGSYSYATTYYLYSE